MTTLPWMTSLEAVSEGDGCRTERLHVAIGRYEQAAELGSNEKVRRQPQPRTDAEMERWVRERPRRPRIPL